MINRLVFIGYQPLTDKVIDDFFINDFQQENINIEYWDLSKYYFPKQVFINSVELDIVKKINKFNELKNSIKKLENYNCIVFINFPYEWRVLDLFLLLTKYNFKIAIIARGMVPLPTLVENFSIKKLVLKLNTKSILNFLKNKIAYLLKKIKLVKNFDIIFFAGIDSFKIAGAGFKIDIKNSNLVSINSADYDRCISSEKIFDSTLKKYIVFLDEYLPFHPDFEMFNEKVIDHIKYYSSLNDFFLRMEKKHKCEVVIAAHPKASLYNSNDFFMKRKVYFGKTLELVKNSEFVIAHMSTSIGYSVFFNKKCILIYTNDLYNKMKNQYYIIKHFSEQLGSKLLNIDKENIDQSPNEININLYNDFKYKYMTNENHENLKSFYIIKHFFNQIK